MNSQLDDLKRLANGMTRAEIGQALDELIESYEQLQSKLDKACEALERVKHNGCCIVCSSVCPACNAHKALAEIRKKDE